MAGTRSIPPTALRWACIAAVALGAVLRAPLLDNGFRDDDYVQRAMLEGVFPLERGVADLFWFAGADAAENERLRDVGYLPWWSAPELRLSMLRPLSSLLRALDHALWPDDPYLQHLHSLAWWALLVVAAWLVLRRALPPAAAAVACFVYALEGAHLIPLAWLANRSTLIASSFAMLALWLHLRWRQERSRTAPWLSAGAASLALCGGEYAFTGLAYVVAYELVLRRDELRARALALLPVGVPCLAYLLLRAGLGYGVQHSGYYIWPFDPAFVSIGGPRAAALAADLAFGVPALWFNLGHLWQRLLFTANLFSAETLQRIGGFHLSHVAVGVVAFALLAVLYLWARRASRGAPLQLGWLVLGALMSLLPAASALPSDRVLVGASFGVSALIGGVIVTAFAHTRSGSRWPSRWGAGALAVACIALHLALPGYAARERSESFAQESAAFRQWARSALFPKHGVEDVHVMVVSASDFTTAANLPWVRQAEGKGLPRSYRRLSGAFRPHALTVVGPRTFELQVLGEPAGLSADSLYRPADLPIVAGYRTQVPGMSVEVLDAIGGIPVRTRFTLDEPLAASERYLLLHATPDGLVPIRLRPDGEPLRLEVAWFPQLAATLLETLREGAAAAGQPPP